MAALTDLLCREYDIYNLPFVKEMQQSNGDIIDGVKQIIENNLAISREFVPGKINADMLFIAASQTADTDMNSVLHNNAEVWREHVAKLSVHSVDCHHQQMFDAQPLEIIGPLIAQSIKAWLRSVFKNTRLGIRFL